MNRPILKILVPYMIIIFSVLTVFGVRIVTLGFKDHDSNFNYTQTTVKPVIQDRNGVVIAANAPVYSLYFDGIYNKQFDDVNAFVNDAKTRFPELNKQKLIHSIANSTFMWIKRNIPPFEYKEFLRTGGLTGILSLKDMKRVYPSSNLTSHLVGSVNKYNVGVTGVERAIDNGKLKSLRVDVENKITLSIDTRVQHIVRKHIKKHIDKHEANFGVAILTNIKTGEVLSAVSMPDYNNNHLDTELSNNVFNRYIMGVYEFGSIMKIITLALAIEGDIQLSKRYRITKKIKIGEFEIGDFTPYQGHMSLKDIIINSSNVGIVKVIREIGHDKQYKLFKRLGLLHSLSTTLGNTTTPLLPKRWNKYSAMTISYGYGIAVTPFHIMQALCSIVNNGVFVPMTFIKQHPHYKPKGVSVISPEVSKLVNGVLHEVVERGTGSAARVHNVKIGGKTGTANKIKKQQYSSKHVLTSFFSTFPIDNPKYSMLVMIDEPSGEVIGRPSGGSVAAPLTRDIIADLAISMPEITHNDGYYDGY